MRPGIEEMFRLDEPMLDTGVELYPPDGVPPDR